MVGFLFGGTTGLSYDDLQDRRKRQDMLTAQILGLKPKNTKEGIGAILQGIGNGIDRYQTNKGMREGREGATSQFDSLLSKITGQPSTGGSSANLPMPGAAAEMAATKPTKYAAEGSTFNPFMSTVRAGGLTNPFALAAVAATGDAESGWSSSNANRTWSDPSESGKPGTAGGVMSWRGPRYSAMASSGDLSPEAQAKFFLSEDPQLIQRLQGAKSVEEAQQMMNRAWAFAGHDRPGGEAARRLSLARGYLPQFQGGGTQVASLDPSAGMSGSAAIEQQAPGSGYVDPMVSAPNAMPQNANMPLPNQSQANNGPMLSQQPQQQAALPAMQPPQTVSQPPQVAAQPQQMAQAQMPQQPQPFGGVDPQVLQLMNNPFLSEEQRQMLQLHVQQQMQQQQSSQEEQRWRARQEYEQQQRQASPEYKLGLEKTQLELNALRNPTPKDTDDIREYNYARQQGFQGSFADFQQQMRRAGATSVTVGGGENRQVFDAVAASADSARSAVTGLNALSEAKRAVDGGIISGAGADVRLGLQRVGALLGVADPQVIQNTETFRSAIAPQVAAMMKATVGSTQISNADREFAQQAAGGSINLDEGTIKRLLGIMDRAGRVAVQSHMDRLNKVYPEGGNFDRERALFGVEMPAAAPEAPTPIDQMTDDELRAIIDGR